MNILYIFEHPGWFLTNPVVLAAGLFQLWMCIDAVRRQEWIWVLAILALPVMGSIWYFFYVYRASMPADAPTFELPGAGTRRRIRELQAQIHHLDKAHHHAQLADVYFSQGKLPMAEQEYVASLERDPTDMEARSHYGQCLLRLGRPQEARPILEKVVTECPQHEYGQSMMMYAETLAQLGEKDASLAAWRKVLEHHTYSQARVNLAQLLLEKGEKEEARRELQDVIADAGHGPAFQKKRERAWVKRARALLKKIN
jgi:hypothetical protein